MSNNTDRFEPFTASDFNTFAGVETDRPLVHYTAWGAVVIDGCRVQAIDNAGQVWQRTLKDEQIARGYAECLADVHDTVGIECFAERIV